MANRKPYRPGGLPAQEGSASPSPQPRGGIDVTASQQQQQRLPQVQVQSHISRPPPQQPFFQQQPQQPQQPLQQPYGTPQGSDATPASRQQNLPLKVQPNLSGNPSGSTTPMKANNTNIPLQPPTRGIQGDIQLQPPPLRPPPLTQVVPTSRPSQVLSNPSPSAYPATKSHGPAMAPRPTSAHIGTVQDQSEYQASATVRRTTGVNAAPGIYSTPSKSQSATSDLLDGLFQSTTDLVTKFTETTKNAEEALVTSLFQSSSSFPITFGNPSTAGQMRPYQPNSRGQSGPPMQGSPRAAGNQIAGSTPMKQSYIASGQQMAAFDEELGVDVRKQNASRAGGVNANLRKGMRRFILDLKSGPFKANQWALLKVGGIIVVCVLCLLFLFTGMSKNQLPGENKWQVAERLMIDEFHTGERLSTAGLLLLRNRLNHGRLSELKRKLGTSQDAASDEDKDALAVVAAVHHIGDTAAVDEIALQNNVALTAGESIFPEKPGMTVLTACSSQPFHIAQACLDSLVNIQDVQEIIMVDWASEPSLSDQFEYYVKSHEKLKLARANYEKDFSLARAYNLAATIASHSNLLFADCSHQLSSSVVTRGIRPLETNIIQSSLSGSLFAITRKDFWSIGGFDERLNARVTHKSQFSTPVHWVMHEFIMRAKQSRMIVKPLDDSLLHALSVDANAANGELRFVTRQQIGQLSSVSMEVLDEAEATYESKILGMVGSWSGCRKNGIGENDSQCSVYNVERVGGGYVNVLSLKKPPMLSMQVSEEESSIIWMEALEDRIVQHFSVPRILVEQITTAEQREYLLEELLSAKRLLVVQVMHGLGNRLRVLASAMAFAKNTHRILVVVWQKDRHIQASYSDLFDSNAQFTVFDTFPITWEDILSESRSEKSEWNSFLLYNYMETELEALKNKLVVDDQEKHIYFRSSSVLNAPRLSTWKLECQSLQSLQPNRQVVELIDRIGPSVAEAIGVHIRMELLSDDIQNLDYNQEYGSNASQVINFWRARAHVSVFLAKMNQILKGDPKATFFVASDTPSALEQVLSALPNGSVKHLPRDCNSRSAECERFALADMILLSKTRYILGSTWSSFTEVAQRFGGQKVLFAGKDFGVAESEQQQ